MKKYLFATVLAGILVSGFAQLAMASSCFDCYYNYQQCLNNGHDPADCLARREQCIIYQCN